MGKRSRETRLSIIPQNCLILFDLSIFLLIFCMALRNFCFSVVSISKEMFHFDPNWTLHSSSMAFLITVLINTTIVDLTIQAILGYSSITTRANTGSRPFLTPPLSVPLRLSHEVLGEFSLWKWWAWYFNNVFVRPSRLSAEQVRTNSSNLAALFPLFSTSYLTERYWEHSLLIRLQWKRMGPVPCLKQGFCKLCTHHIPKKLALLIRILLQLSHPDHWNLKCSFFQ